MTRESLLKQFVTQIDSVFKPGLNSLSEEAQQQLKLAAKAAFEKMDLVTRDEFEAQRAVLMRSRQKLDQLEKTLESLEKQLKSSNK